eukprot:7430013-Pyramimonas_sp.AAC.2
MDTNNEMDQVSHLGWSDAKAEPRADPPANWQHPQERDYHEPVPGLCVVDGPRLLVYVSCVR